MFKLLDPSPVVEVLAIVVGLCVLNWRARSFIKNKDGTAWAGVILSLGSINLIIYSLLWLLCNAVMNKDHNPAQVDYYLGLPSLLSLVISIGINFFISLKKLRHGKLYKLLKADTLKKVSQYFFATVAYAFTITIKLDYVKYMLQTGLSLYAGIIIPIWLAVWLIEYLNQKPQSIDDGDLQSPTDTVRQSDEYDNVTTSAEYDTQSENENNIEADIQPPAKKELTRKKILR